jgi:site-specific DNA-cytosine methylase
MKHASLFSGIGGFDLAAEWMGWDNVFHCEWMEFPRKILDYYWPNADSHVDICNTDFTKYANTIDILPTTLIAMRSFFNPKRDTITFLKTLAVSIQHMLATQAQI